jgi:type III restriction enzyme
MSEQNPILNSPYKEPQLHYATDVDGSLDYNNIVKGRRIFTPDIQVIPQRQKDQKSIFEVNDLKAQYGTHLINLIRNEVKKWRNTYEGTTRVTRELLDFWFRNTERHAVQKLFFAQRESVETAIWLNEVAEKSNAGQNILNKIHAAQQTVSEYKSQQLPRIAFKMATGTGKTVVMACLENPASFGQRFRFDSDSDSGIIRTAIPKNIRTLMGIQSE